MNLEFKRSSFCGAGGCVEVATVPPEFVTSSFTAGLAACVAVGLLPGGAVAIRDTKLGDDSPVLSFSASDWQALRSAIKADELGYPELGGVIHSLGCVRLSRLSGTMVVVSDVHQPEQVLEFTQAEWDAFIKGVQNNEF